MQQQIRYFSCPLHPKDILSSVCRSGTCSCTDYLLCAKCMESHKNCSGTIVSLQEFLEELDSIGYIQYDTSDYVKLVKSFEADTLQALKKLRNNVTAALNAAEKKCSDHCNRMIEVHRESVHKVAPNVKDRFSYSKFQEFGQLNKEVNTHMKRLIACSSFQEQLVLHQQNSKKRVGQLHHTIAKKLEEIGDFLKKGLNSVNSEFSHHISNFSCFKVNYPNGMLFIQPDSTSPFFKLLAVDGRKLTVKRGFTSGYFPIFLTKTPIKGRQSFTIEITAAGNNQLMVGVTTLGDKQSTMDGVTTSDNRSQVNTYCKQSMYLCTYSNFGHYINGALFTSFTYAASSGDRLQVRVDLKKNTMEWLRVYPMPISIGMVSIPMNLRNKELYPALEIHGTYTGAVTLL